MLTRGSGVTMMTTSMRWAILLALLLLTACGGDNGDDDSQVAPATRTALLPAVTELPTGSLPPDAVTAVASLATTLRATPEEIEDPPGTPERRQR